MPSAQINPGKKLANITLICQLSLVLVTGLVVYMSGKSQSALSLLTGGMICVFTSALYAFFSFKIAGGSKYLLIYKNIKSGRKAKLSLSIILLLICFNMPQIEQIDLLIGYCLALFAQYPIMYLSHRFLS